MSILKLLSWNMNQKVANWQAVIDSAVDVAMLQEAKPPPKEIAESFILQQEPNSAESKLPWRAMIAGAAESDSVEITPIKTQPLGGRDIEALMVSRDGSLAAAAVKIKDTGEEVIVVSMYSTWMSPIKQTGSSWIYSDASAHRLVSDLSGLIGRQKGHKIIAAGDLNILYGYGEENNLYWAKRYSTIFDRMDALGMRFVGPQAPEGGRQADPWPKELPEESLNVPTFYHNRQSPATASRQLDFVFASESIAERVKVKALNREEEWGPSDHCRILIELN